MPFIGSISTGSAKGFGHFRKNGASLKFSISPAVSGKSTWDLDVDGPLTLSAAGTWTITPLSAITVQGKMWGAGGGSGRNGAVCTGGAGGYAFANDITLTSGVAYKLIVGQGGMALDTTGGGMTNGSYKGTSGYGQGGAATQYGGSGGGGTAICVSSNYTPILVAGGGGGGGSESNNSGAGGGTNGQNGEGSSGQGAQGITPGSSVQGDVAATAWSGSGGGNGGYGTYVSGGGGGGYAGGGCMDTNSYGGGGGGSGYANVSYTSIYSLATGNLSTPPATNDGDRSSSGSGATTTSRASDGKIILRKPSTLVARFTENNAATNGTFPTSWTFNTGILTDQVTNGVTNSGGVLFGADDIVAVDLGSTKTIASITPYGTFGNLSWAYSTDGENWTRLQAAQTPVTPGNPITFNVSARYVAIATGNGGAICYEISVSYS